MCSISYRKEILTVFHQVELYCEFTWKVTENTVVWLTADAADGLQWQSQHRSQFNFTNQHTLVFWAISEFIFIYLMSKQTVLNRLYNFKLYISICLIIYNIIYYIWGNFTVFRKIDTQKLIWKTLRGIKLSGLDI